jgi:formate-dependent nitrite reductase membrane component NrfD
MGDFEQAHISTNVIDLDFDLCKPKIFVKSKFNCSVSKLETVSVFFEQYYWIFAILFIAFGAYNIV